ncbi:hypothetical protein [Bartonella sp. CB60]|uniref:hypothetical protein n=1 Tax=Bartonella sp. CB60 TaxID=3113619 RepID=UPI00300E4028
MNISIDSLCDLWMALFHICNDDRFEDNDCDVIVKIMSVVENALVLRLQNEVPNVIKALAILTNFGDSGFPRVMDSFLKTYDPSLESPVKMTESLL